MPNDTEQPTDRAGRGALVILFVVAAIGVGLWFALEWPKLSELAGDAASPAGDAQTAVSGAASTDADVQTAGAAADSADADAQPTTAAADSADADAQPTTAAADSADADAQPTTAAADSADDDAQSTTAATDSTDADAQPTVAAADSADDDAQSTVAAADSADDDARSTTAAADSTDADAQPTVAAADSADDDAQSTVAGTASPAGDVQSPGAGTADSQDPTPPLDPDATGDATRIAAIEPGTTPVDEATRVSPAPDSTVEKTPIDGPPEAEATEEAGVLAAVGRVIEQIETAIEEGLDTALEVQVTYDDSQVDAPQDGEAPAEVTATADPDATLAAGGARIPDSDTPAPESTVEKTPIDGPPDAEATGAGVLAAVGRVIEQIETAVEEGLDTAPQVQATHGDSQVDAPQDEKAPTEAAPTADPDTTLAAGGARVPDSDTTLAAGGARVPDSGVPAPDSTVEKTPIDGPPDAEATGAAGVLAAVGRVIEQIETVIEEGVDTALEVQVTYDDSQVDPPKDEEAPTEAAPTADPDAALAAADGARVPDSGAALAAGDARVPDSDAGAGADAPIADSSGSGGVAPPDTTAAAAAGSTEAEAKKYVETLTATAPQTIPVDKADHFVTQERVISLVPEDTIESVSVEELASDEALSPDTPITVVREVEQVENAVAEQLIADSGGDLDKELRVQVTYDDSQDETGTKVVEEDDVQKITVREALERIRTEPDRPLPVIKTVRYFQVMTLKELLDASAGEDAFLSVVTRPYRIESATLADLLERQQAENPDSIFYLHTVLPTDDQGIWGIVHFGIIDNFARGMAIRQGKDIETFTVRIPRHADERLPDRSSSFLGLMIDRKTKESYVYNFRNDRMGRNPDRIFPGQELVIINFQPEELMTIYRHFAAS